MDDTKLSDLKAHDQFLLGRIDCARWVQQNFSGLTADDKERLDKYLKHMQNSEGETSGKINNILAERERKKQEAKDAKLAAEKERRGY